MRTDEAPNEPVLGDGDARAETDRQAEGPEQTQERDPANQANMTMRIRLTFAKTNEMRFTGHLDLHRTLERTFRRAKLPLAYSQGFHPQPRINLAAALPLGFTSVCEVADVWLEEQVGLEDIRLALEPALPPGIHLEGIETVDGRLPALQVTVRAAEYEVILLDPVHNLAERIQRVLAADTLIRERRGKRYDLRPLIESIEMECIELQGRTCLRMVLAAREAATGRPEEVLSEMGIFPESTKIHRTKLFFN